MLAAVQRAAPWAEPGGIGAVEVDERLAVGAREQESRFLEALAHGGDVVVEAAFLEAEATARFAIVEAGARGVSERVGLLNDAARKYPGAAVVVATLGAA